MLLALRRSSADMDWHVFLSLSKTDQIQLFEQTDVAYQ